MVFDDTWTEHGCSEDELVYRLHEMADEYREERRLARKAEYERYQPSILEV